MDQNHSSSKTIVYCVVLTFLSMLQSSSHKKQTGEKDLVFHQDCPLIFYFFFILLDDVHVFMPSKLEVSY